MPERRFETAYWSDPFVMKLPAKAKLLYIYFWTNIHCNQAGLYEIAPETISFETGLALEELPKLIDSLEPKVSWYPEQNLVWIRNFLRRQSKSPQFLAAAAKCLETINNNGLVREFLDYNQKYNLSIPYQYPIDREVVSDSDTVSNTDTDTGADTEGLGAGKREGGKLSGEIQELFDLWNSLGVIKHKKLTGQMMRALRATLRDFSAADVSQAMKNYATILHDDSCFFKYRWTLKDFLARGLEKFLDLEVALNNYRKGGADGRTRKAGQDTQRNSHDWEETPEPDGTT